jgi:hypothetical protein
LKKYRARIAAGAIAGVPFTIVTSLKATPPQSRSH